VTGYGAIMIKLSWIMQIIITLSYLLISYLIILDKGNHLNLTSILILIVFAITYLCKIPLVTAIYYSSKKIWSFVFVLALLIICYSEFEAYITYIEMVNYERHQIEERDNFLFVRAMVIAFFVVIIPPTTALIGLRLKNK
tara:strand:+ start:32 stop:451 length:420 start_codon:yes stop_codon:yes gene_type:complete